MFSTITAMKAANAAAGHHFFDASSMRFFRSKIESKVIAGQFFVTSEQFVSSQGEASPRTFTARSINAEGHVTTVGEFGGHATKAEAIEAIKAAASSVTA